MLRLRVPRSATAAALLLVVGLSTGCGAGASGSTPSWQAQPDFQGNVDPNPQLPDPGIPAPSLPGGPLPSPSPSSSAGRPGAPATDPNVVATKLDEPTGLVVLPDGSALVAERRSGKIFRVQPQAGQPVLPVQTLAGVDGSGDGGLLDLAISPTYAEDGLIYAYLTTATDNRVVHFALGSTPSTVIGGIPRGASGNSGRLAFDATGALLVGTGDAGNPALASSSTSLAGKILRTDDIGQPLPDNPVAGSPIFARGLTSPDGVGGLCVDPRTGARIAVSGNKLIVVKAAANYTAAAGAATLPAAAQGGGGCALSGGQLLVATSTGEALAIAAVGAGDSIATFTTSLSGTYGRLRTVVAGQDGALWLTTRNRDGHGKPVADDDRVIRITSVDSASPVV